MSAFKSNIVVIALLLTTTLFITGGYFALDRLVLSFSYPESVVLAKDIIITPAQTEIIGNNLLKVNKEEQFVALVLESDYTSSPHHAIQDTEGEFITVEIKLIDEEGNEFPLHLDSFRSPSINGDVVPEFGYLKGYNTLPIGKVFKKVVLRSNKTLKVKSVLWSGYNTEDRK